MFDRPEVLGMASAMAQNASTRLSAIARNVANADTPGYRAVDAPSFRDSYRSDAVAQAFGAFLDRARPDLVHFHHVTCLSTTCVHEASRRGVGVVFTLHDFWLMCPRGQLLRRDLSLCERHDDAAEYSSR